MIKIRKIESSIFILTDTINIQVNTQDERPTLQ